MIHGDIVNIRDATLNMPIHQANEFANRDRGVYSNYQVYMRLTHALDIKHSTYSVPIPHFLPS